MTSAPIYAQLTAERYHHPDTTPQEEPPVNLLADIRDEIGRAITWTEDEFRAKLPTIARLADHADAIATSAPVQAVLGAVLSPEDEQLIVGLVQRLDQRVNQAAADAAAEAAPEQPAPAPEPEPAPPAESFFTPQPGPVIAGQAR